MGTRDKQFNSEVLSPYSDQILESAIEFMEKTYEPNEIFPDVELKGYVASNFDPEEVFDDTQLAKWAEENGYTKEA